MHFVDGTIAIGGMVMSKMIGKSLLMAAVILGNAAFTAAAYADEVQEYNLDDMVVTATRTMKQIQEVPASVSVVTAKDIQAKNISALPEALQMLPGVYMSQSPTYGSAGSLEIRGFASNNILVLLDGMPINTAHNNEVQWEMIPVENVERIEVAKGAGSSLYGGRAVGAVVNILTKNHKDKGAHVNAVVNYGSNNSWKKALYVDVKANDKISFGVGYENKKTDGYKNYLYTASAKKINNSVEDLVTPDELPPQLSNGKYILGGRGDKALENENITANIKYNFDADKSLKYTYTRAESTYKYAEPWTTLSVNGRPTFSGNIDLGNGTYLAPSLSSSYLGYDGKKESDTHTLSYVDDKNKFSVNMGYFDVGRNGYSTPSSAKTIYWEGSGSDSYYPSKTYNIDMQKAWENIGKHTIVVGADYRQESFEQFVKSLTNWRNHDSVDTSKYNRGLQSKNQGKSKNYALFVQDEYKISEPLTMYLGLRYDKYKKLDGRTTEYDIKTGSKKYDKQHDEASYSELSPKIAFNYKQDENTSYFASYGHSFNPPPLYQVYRGSVSTSSYQANPELEPEVSDTFEVGMKQKIDDKTSMGISLFRVNTDDKIVGATFKNADGSSVKKYANFNKETRKGIEFEVNHAFNDNWKGYFNYTWQQGKLDQGAVAGTTLKAQSVPLDVPKHLMHAGINYTHDKWNALLECQYVSERNTSDTVTGEYGSEDAFFIVNTAFNYEIAKNTTLQFTVNNLFDREFYCSDMTPGRVYSVGLRYNF